MRSSLIVAIRTGRRTTLCLAAVLLSLAVATRAADEAKQAAESSRKHALGQTVKNFELDDVSGKEVRLADFQDKSIIVLFSLGTECAISTAYLDELNQLQSRFSAQGLQVLGVDANAGATADEAAELYKKHEVRFPVLLDADQQLADSLNLERTAEALLLDAKRVVRYHGRVDDRYADPAKPIEPTRRELMAAIEELVAGKAVTVSHTESTGTPISRPLVNPVAYTPESIRRGRAFYLSSCADCHSFDGTGADSDVTENAPDLTDIDTWASDGSPEATFLAIRDGAGDEMPPFKDDFPDETDIWHMVNFIRSLQK